MKIEPAESLFFSWLRHVKKCQVVQMNWKPSPYWATMIDDDHESFIERSRKFFADTPYCNLYKNNASGAQLVKQAEIDVVGVRLNNLKIEKIFAIDTAFHENGLIYGGSKEETVVRVVKKMVRTSMVIESCFRGIPCKVIFASPKITKGVLEPLKSAVDKIREFAGKHDLQHHQYDLIANEQFAKDILCPLLNLSSDVADTSELFMRSCQLLSLFPNYFNFNESIESEDLSDSPDNEKVPAYISGPTSKNVLPIDLTPSAEKEFKEALLRTKRAEILVHYKDGKTIRKEWSAEKFNGSSDVLQNLRSRSEFRQGTWQNSGITHVSVLVIGE